jgi:hypothetical protein
VENEGPSPHIDHIFLGEQTKAKLVEVGRISFVWYRYKKTSNIALKMEAV